MNRQARYILNESTKTYHDAHNLQEKCNTDQILHKERAEEPPDDYRPCEHCIETEPIAY